MTAIRREDVAAAATYLVKSRKCASLLNTITRIIDNYEHEPLRMGGERVCLNALIDLGLDDRAKFERVVTLIRERRALLPATRIVEYQRNQMRERRARLGDAVELQELLKGKMTPAQREKYKKDIQRRWMEARGKYVRDHGGGSWAERNELINEFWETIDKQLRTNLEAARKK